MQQEIAYGEGLGNTLSEHYFFSLTLMTLLNVQMISMMRGNRESLWGNRAKMSTKSMSKARKVAIALFVICKTVSLLL